MKQAHIHCDKVDENVILVGDPARVNRVRAFLSSVRDIAVNREFVSIQGYYKHTPVTVISTGMGAPSALICVEELISCGAKKIIRVGSAGAYQHTVKLGDLIVVQGAVRNDGGSNTYIESSYPAVPDLQLTAKILQNVQSKNYPHHFGIIRCHDSFYREDEDSICQFWNKYGVLGADMETAGILILSKLKNIQAASILNNVVEYNDSVKQSVLEFSQNESITSIGEQRSIEIALESLL